MTALREKDFERSTRALRVLLGAYADWFLRPTEVKIERVTGDVAVILLTKSAQLKCFPEAFLLPVRWVKSSDGHSTRLPPHVTALAQQVLDFMGRGYLGWRLAALDPSFEAIDLSQMKLTGDSPIGALATSLAIAATGSTLKRRKLLTSVGWDGVRLSPVGDIDKKVALLAGIGGCDIVVHPEDEALAVASARRAVTVTTFKAPTGSAPFLSHFKTLLDLLESPPSKQAGHSLDARLGYYNRDDIDADADARLAYYDNEVREDLSIVLRGRAEIDPGSSFLLAFNPVNLPLAALMIDLVAPEHLVVIRQQANAQYNDMERARIARLLASYKYRYRYPDVVVDIDPSNPDPGIRAAITKMRGAPGKGRAYVDMQNATGFLRAASLCIGIYVGATPIALEQRWSGRKLKVHADAAVQILDFANRLLLPRLDLSAHTP